MSDSLLIQLSRELEPISDEFLESFFPATHFLQEWREYFVLLDGIDQLRVNDGERLHPIVKQETANIFRIYVENSLGLTVLQPMTANRPVGEPVWVEVVSRKFPTPETHLDLCQTLIKDLFEQAANLPFNFSDKTQRGVAEALRPPTPIFTYHFLKQSLETFKDAIEIILAQPYRVLYDHADHVLLHEASEVDGDVILSILQSPETWVPTVDFELSRMLQVDGKPYAPQRVWQWLPEETFDTPENRFVLHFLRQVLTSAELLPTQNWWKYVQNLDEANVVQELTSMLRQAISHPMFDDVGEMYTIPFHSQVLMRREGYRDLMGLWQQFHTARSPLFDKWQQAIDLRAIHWLYELWVFFKLIETIDEIAPLEKLEIGWSDEQGVGYGSKAVFHGGDVLYYNQTFRPQNTKSTYSYSMVLRPDYVWISQGRQVVLDAKFSMQISESELENEIEGEISERVRDEHPVRENLYKMHTYRDALVGTQAAVILYPGNKPVFMPTSGPRVKDFTLEEVLSGKLDGIGALSLKPREKEEI